jgi:hypothetical protein
MTPAPGRTIHPGVLFGFLAVGLCVLQSAVMFIGATTLLSYEPAARFVRDHFGFLQDYIPMFGRYAAIFAEKGRTEDFLPFVSVYLFFFLLQSLTILCLVICFIVVMANRGTFRAESIGFWRSLIGLALFCFLAFPFAELFFGLTDIKNPGVYGNGVLYGDYLTAVYVFCLLIPFGNGGTFLLALAPFFERDMTRRVELEPIKNPDRVWTIDRLGKDAE